MNNPLPNINENPYPKLDKKTEAKILDIVLSNEEEINLMNRVAKEEEISPLEVLHYYVKIGIKSEDEQDDFQKLLKLQKKLYKKQPIQEAPRVLIDSSLIQDYLFCRESIFLKDITKIYDFVFSEKIIGYITEIGLREIHDNMIKVKNLEKANETIIMLLNNFRVCTVSKEIIKEAFFHTAINIESAIKIEAAKRNNIDFIVSITQNNLLADDWCWHNNVISPSEFLQICNQGRFVKISHRIGKNFSQREINNPSLNKNISDKRDDLPLFADWKIKDFKLLTCKNSGCQATVIVKNNHGDEIRHSAWDKGSLAALSRALDKIIEAIPNHQIIKYKVIDASENLLQDEIKSSVYASVTFKTVNGEAQAYHVDKDTVKAHFYAYIKAIGLIYEPINDNKHKPLLPMKMPLTKVNLIHLYKKNTLESTHMNVRGIDLSQQKLPSLNLSHSDLSYSNLEYATLNKACFAFSKLVNAKLSHASLIEANLAETDFTSAKLYGANLSSAKLNYATLINVKLNNTILRSANLNRANLRMADLKNAKLNDADLTGANLTQADLTEANLQGANLTGVNLTGATLLGTNLENAIIEETDFSKINRSSYFIEMSGKEKIKLISQFLKGSIGSKTVVCAVHSFPHESWVERGEGHKYFQTNAEIAKCPGVKLIRVFIIPDDVLLDQESGIKDIIDQQAEAGIEVYIIYESKAKDIEGFELHKTSLLVCENHSDEKKSFTVELTKKEENAEENSYLRLSSQSHEIIRNKQNFELILKEAEPYEYIDVSKTSLKQNRKKKKRKPRRNLTKGVLPNKMYSCNMDGGFCAYDDQKPNPNIHSV